MTVFTDYLWFNTKKRQEFIRITDEIAASDTIQTLTAMAVTILFIAHILLSCLCIIPILPTSL